MSRPASPEAVAEVRRRHPDLDDLPDEAVARLFVTHHVGLNLALCSLGVAVRDALPARIGRLFT